ncbi:MAG TPA: hypothetical protein PKY82_05515 [Pyrinomonadaceae bacterium]|nr:hypothetical protein [Pyrinomonadaceae bacterium]
MKVCLKCQTQYDNDTVFCLNDGTPLVFSDSTDKTLVMNNNLPQDKAGSSTGVPTFDNQSKSRSDLLFGVIAGILFIFSALLLVWNFNLFGKKSATVEANSNKKTPIVESTPDLRKFNETFYAGLKDRLANYSKDNGLKPLADNALPNESLEIRLYLLAGFYGPVYKGFAVGDSVLILKKDNANWSGTIIRNVIKSNSDKPNAREKIITSLNSPVSGWENLWQTLQNNGIFAPPTLSENIIKTDATLYVIESNANGKYTYSYFHTPKESSPIDEEKRIAGIFNLIAKEFDISDLKAN